MSRLKLFRTFHIICDFVFPFFLWFNIYHFPFACVVFRPPLNVTVIISELCMDAGTIWNGRKIGWRSVSAFDKGIMKSQPLYTGCCLSKCLPWPTSASKSNTTHTHSSVFPATICLSNQNNWLSCSISIALVAYFNIHLPCRMMFGMMRMHPE